MSLVAQSKSDPQRISNRLIGHRIRIVGAWHRVQAGKVGREDTVRGVQRLLCWVLGGIRAFMVLLVAELRDLHRLIIFI